MTIFTKPQLDNMTVAELVAHICTFSKLSAKGIARFNAMDTATLVDHILSYYWGAGLID